MNVIKPRGLGIVTRVCRDPPKTFLSIGVLGFVDFRQPQAFLPDTEMWPFVKGALPENTPLDPGMPKVFGEVLVFGKAMPKGGAAVPAMAVEFSLGTVRKRAIVFGDRYWRLGTAELRPTAPKPFVEMPIDYAHAFGGEGFARNPLGKGVAAARRTQSGELVALPNVESPERPIVSAADQPEPHGFGPLDIAWPQRSGKAGSFDQRWVRSRFPAPPADQEPTIHNAAPPDQWVQNWFTAEEAFMVSGMHGDYEAYSGRLSGMRARAFIRQTQPDGALALLEVMLHAETVFLFPTDLRGIILYRGRAPAADNSGRDITDLMIAYERLHDEPRSHPYYAEVFALRTDPETKGLHAMNDLQLSPALPPEVQAERDAEREEYATAELEKRQRRLDRQYDAHLAKMGLALQPGKPRPKVKPSALPIVTPSDISRGEVDIAGFITAARRMIGDEQARVDALLAKGKAELGAVKAEAERQGERALAMPAQQQAQLTARDTPAAQRAAAKIGEGIAAAKARLSPEALARHAGQTEPAATNLAGEFERLRTQLTGLADQLRGRLAGTSGEGRAQLLQGIHAIEEALSRVSGGPAGSATSADAAAASAGASPAAGVAAKGNRLLAALDAATARFPADLRPEVMARVADAKARWGAAMQEFAAATPSVLPKIGAPPSSSASGTDAAERLAPQDDTALQALDAKFAAAFDDGRQKSRLISTEPLAPRETLSAEQSRLLRQEAQAAAMRGTSLAGRDFAGADLSELDFSGLDLTGAMFEKANLTGTNFSDATLARAIFTGATLRNARLDRANLQEANLCRVTAEGASLTHTSLTRARMLYANFAKANLSNARFDQNQIIEAHFDSALLRDSRWDMCAIVRSTASAADFSGAQMRLCTIMSTDLSGLIARGITLFRVSITDCPADAADFSESTLTRMAAAGASTFRNALFRRANASRSSWFKVDLSGANFNRAELDQAFIGEAKAVQASFYRASLRNAVLIGTDFTDADLAEANLFMAILRNATLDRAELRYASLYGANTEGVSWRLCDLTSANLRLTEFTRG